MSSWRRGEAGLFLSRRLPEEGTDACGPRFVPEDGARPAREEPRRPRATQRRALLPAGGREAPGAWPLRPAWHRPSHTLPKCTRRPRAQGLGGAPGQALRTDPLGKWITTNKRLLGGEGRRRLAFAVLLVVTTERANRSEPLRRDLPPLREPLAFPSVPRQLACPLSTANGELTGPLHPHVTGKTAWVLGTRHPSKLSMQVQSLCFGRERKLQSQPFLLVQPPCPPPRPNPGGKFFSRPPQPRDPPSPGSPSGFLFKLRERGRSNPHANLEATLR